MSTTTIHLARAIPSFGESVEVEESVNAVRGALNRSVDGGNDRPFHETSFTLVGGDKRIVLRPDLIVAVTGEIIRRADGSEADHSADELEPQAA